MNEQRPKSPSTSRTQSRSRRPRQSSQRPHQRPEGRQRRSQRVYVPRKKRLVILENRHSSAFREDAVAKLASFLREKNFDVELLQPQGPKAMAIEASRAIARKPFAMVAAGGDGAVNLVARALVGSGVRLAIFPLGKFNNIFTSLYGPPSMARAREVIISDQTRTIDCGKVSGQPFFGSIGLGLLPALQQALENRSLPRFAMGWTRLVAQTVAEISRDHTPVKIDSYRFDLQSLLVNVNLLSYSVGLPLAPAALTDDHKFEVTLDMGVEGAPLSKVIRDIYKRKYFFDDGVRLYRGEEITIGSVKGRTLYLDGELIEVPTNTLEITFYSKRLKVCSPAN